ncbi:MAG: putative oxidoreductase C-terminal domain-containing protein [Cyclobacteriaceae bacterium]
MVLLLAIAACSEKPSEEKLSDKPVTLITLDPGHFHAHLVQKDMYEQVNPTVYVYAPEGEEVQDHLQKISAYNTRAENPTSWQEELYLGNDFLEKMISEKKGNVVVMAGNNRKKTEYIKRSVEAGLHVLSDKPMAITADNFEVLKEAFEIAAKNNVLLYDIMTERHEITSILQKEFSHVESLFGALENGSEEEPAVVKESVHHFYKYVAGSVLKRPSWFFDVEQQGEGIVDVTTHLVDLIQWACFPEKIIDYNTDIEMLSAIRWPTLVTNDEFMEVTRQSAIPDYLLGSMGDDSLLHIYANGEINYKINGVHAKVIVKWDYQAPEGAADTHYSIMRGTKANLIIKQGEEQNYKPVLYIEPSTAYSVADLQAASEEALKALVVKFPGIELVPNNAGWEVKVPDSYDVGHEAHFTQVTTKYLEYFAAGKLPDWEVPNMITKYYITTKALEMARTNDLQ